MKKLTLATFVALIIASTLAFLTYTSTQPPPAPSPCKNGEKKWRLGYYEGGAWRDYQGNLRGIVNGLMKLGWMEPRNLPLPPNNRDTFRLWQWLSENAESPYMEFVPDAYWSSHWKSELRRENKNEALLRLSKKKDLDLVIAAGTWAGQDLANNRHSVPTIVVSASNPVQSGIVRSAEDSGLDHVFAKVDPERYIRQLRLFHSLVKFKRLGVVYEDTPEGRSYAGLEDVYTVAREKGFEVLTCKTRFSNLTVPEAIAGTLQCVQELAPRIDAFYVTDHRGQALSEIKAILKPLNAHKIPTWAQSGSEFVKNGVLFSSTKVEYDAHGLFYARVIANLFNGRRLRDLNQVFEGPKSLAVNLRTADEIGFDVPSSIKRNADTVYHRIAE